MKFKILCLIVAALVLFTSCSGANNSQGEGSSSDYDLVSDINELITLFDDEDKNNSKTGGAENGSSATGGTPGNRNNDAVSSSTASQNVAQSSLLKITEKDVAAGTSEGSILNILLWRKLTDTEEAIIKKFEKSTGMNVITTVTTEAMYGTKLASMMASDNKPDIVTIGSEGFPGIATALQPIKDSVFNLSDPGWTKSYMDNFKINGKYYAVSRSGSFTCESGAYVSYYNRNALAGMADPYSLFKQGKWCWSSAQNIVSAFKQKNKSRYGIVFDKKDLYLNAAGAETISYSGGKFVSNIENASFKSVLTAAFDEMASLNEKNLIANYSGGINNGNVAFHNADAFGLSRESGRFDNIKSINGIKSLGAVPIPGQSPGKNYIPTNIIGWGIIDKTPNYNAAAYLINSLIAPENYTSDFFYNSQMRDVYGVISKGNKVFRFTSGVMNYDSMGNYDNMCSDLVNKGNAEQNIKSYGSAINKAVKKSNQALSGVK